MRLDEGAAAAVGRTPLVRLAHFSRRTDVHVWAKLEYLNPNGSAKDRPALHMLRCALRDGWLSANSVLIESSSGNMAISLASFCAQLGIRFICVLDVKTSAQNVRILQALGAQLEWVMEPDAVSGEFLPARLARVRQLLAEVSGAVWLNQYENEANPRAHGETTFAELQAELPGIDYVIAGMSTCGTVHGIATAIRDAGLATRLIGVDALGSKIAADTSGCRRFPGLGAGFSPPFYEAEDLQRVVHVSDDDCVEGCRRLAATEGMLVGASSGGVCAAYLKMEDELAEGATVVLIMHDRGERYLETVFDEQ